MCPVLPDRNTPHHQPHHGKREDLRDLTGEVIVPVLDGGRSGRTEDNHVGRPEVGVTVPLRADLAAVATRQRGVRSL